MHSLLFRQLEANSLTVLNSKTKKGRVNENLVKLGNYIYREEDETDNVKKKVIQSNNKKGSTHANKD